MVGEHGAVIKNLYHLEDAGLAFGPVAGIRLADGRWVGGSHFTAESIEAVRFRQKSRATEPDAATLGAALEKAPRVTGYETHVTEQGPLFVEATIRCMWRWCSANAGNDGSGELLFIALLITLSFQVGRAADLKAPPGKDRWWSGQTAQRFSTEQLRTCIAKAHEHGIGVLGYADYSVIFGFCGFDFGRRFPDCLDWRTQNDTIAEHGACKNT